jgi:uncharacterized protein (TIGR00369 family)
MIRVTDSSAVHLDDIRDNLRRQSFMNLIGAEATVIDPGRVVIEMPYRDDLCQQNGFLHAGVVTSIADSACGYAALTLMPADSDVLSVEFKVNLLAPASGDRFRATADVVRSGRTLTVVQAQVVALTEGQPDALVAMMQATMIRRPSAPGAAGAARQALEGGDQGNAHQQAGGDQQQDR